MEVSQLPDQYTLLVVDDEPLVTDLFRQFMTRRGFRVLVAMTGAEALQTAEQDQNVSLVITDMSMPGMDGLELAEALLARKPEIPVLIATGHDASAGIPGAPANVVAIVQKPFQNRDLVQTIRTILGIPSESS
jgi:CheY-like chemotaxis protein